MTACETSCMAKQPISKYFGRLSVSDKRRYLEKTKYIRDPYCYSFDSISGDDLPAIRSHNIFKLFGAVNKLLQFRQV